MMSEALRRVRAFEKEHWLAPDDPRLPLFHLTGGIGWINDPNGFSLYKGEIHLFFQYHPYATYWGPMHWGHVKSRDLIRWERLPAALAPDMPYDAAGCFSGSAIELEDGRHLLMYTAVRKDALPDGGVRELQTQCLAFGDGLDYEKYDGNPVIDAALLPPGGDTHDFRDPKLWREDGRFYAVMGNRCPDGCGAVLLYESEDALRWRLKGELAASHGHRGRMWECPDFFRLDGTDVLIVSPQEMQPEELEFIEGNTTLCLLGRFEREGCRFDWTREQTMDYGLDFYAPQTLLLPDGRRVLIAWMQYWESAGWCPEGLPFYGQMTVPRELFIRDGRLYQRPVRELEAYRGAKTEVRALRLSGACELEGIRGRCLDMSLTVRPETEGSLRSFTLHLASGGDYDCSLRWDCARRTLLVDRSRAGFPPEIRNTREFETGERDGTLRLRVLLDRWSMELFVNDGEHAASFTLYAPQSADGIRFEADGAALLDVEKYDLEFENHGQTL